MDLLVAASSGAGFVIFCESEYACFRLFKRRTTLFFYVCQLAILSSGFFSAWNTLLYFDQNLRVLSMLVISGIIKCINDMSYPIMMLLRLRFVRYFPRIVMYIPIVLVVITVPLRFFVVHWLLTGERYYFNALFIVQPIITVLLTVEYIVINIFFIVIAIKHFENIVQIRSIVIINLIVIALECVGGEILFLFTDKWITLCIIAIVSQTKVRLEIEILSYIVQSVRERRTEFEGSPSEGVRNKFCYFFCF
jgi:hypothetical protein